MARSLRSASLRRPLAKLTKPSASGLVYRERLFAHLDAQMEAPGRLIWVWGPAGAGKTSLVSSWLEARGLAHLWYHIDRGDSDPATLLRYLALAVDQRTHRRSPRLPQLSPERLPGFAVFVRRFFEACFDRLPGPLVLVFDNFQELASDSPSIEVIAASLAVLPGNLRLACISREQAPPAFARARAEFGSRELSWDALRFTDSEARELAGRPDAHSKAEELNRVARGWAAGIRILLRSSSTVVPLEPGDNTPLFDYFAYEVFDRFDEGLRTFLLRSAVLPHLTPRIAATLTQDSFAGARLQWLHKNGLFTELRVQQGHLLTYEYHPLFRTFLRARSLRLLGEAELTILSRHAAQLLTQAGDVEDAAILWIAAREWHDLAELICQHAPALAAEGRFQTLASWIQAIPEEELRRKHPWLCYWEGICVGLQDPAGARAHLVRAAQAFQEAGDPQGRALAIAALIRGHFMEWGQFKAMDPWVEELQELWTQAQGRLPIQIQVQVLCCGPALLMRAPEHPLLKQLVERAGALIAELPTLEHRVRIVEFLVHYLHWAGDFTRSEAICRQTAASRRGDPWFWPSFQLVHGMVEWQAANHDAAFAILEEGLEGARRHGLTYLEPLFHGQIGETALSAGELDRLQRAIQAGKAANQAGQNVNDAHLDFLHAGWLLATGDTESAVASTERSLEKMQANAGPFLEALAWNICGQILAIGGQHDRARGLLGKSLTFARQMPSKIAQFHALVPLAWSHFQTGDALQGTALLREAFRLGAQQSYMNCHPYWNPKIMSDLCARALGAGIETDYVTRLIRKRGLTPPHAETEQWPWPVRLYTLGRLSVMIDGNVLSFGPKVPKKPLELLRALLAKGGRCVSVERVSEYLWPDLEADAARNALDIALHRLRKLLGRQSAIRSDDGKLSLDERLIWVDIWSFERYSTMGEQLGGGAATLTEVRHIAEHILQLYRGHFLADEGTVWAMDMRERLRSKLLRALAKLGAVLESARQWDPAIELYRRGIELDPLVEENHRHLMRCYASQGRTAEALETYKRCRDLLAASFGVEPSPGTQADYRALTSH